MFQALYAYDHKVHKFSTLSETMCMVMSAHTAHKCYILIKQCQIHIIGSCNALQFTTIKPHKKLFKTLQKSKKTTKSKKQQ